ncbi:hypothetical protein KJ980_05060 [Patescibacteria group bacterium]|nr:hypothetical protein [Patescibacteria group bacterium]
MTKEAGQWNNIPGRQTYINQEKPVFSKDILLRMALNEYKRNPLEHENYWKKHWKILSREENLKIFVPRLNIPKEKLIEWEKSGLKPIPVPEAIRGPKGLELLSSMYRGKIDIWPVPEIKNNTTESTWRLIQLNPVLNKEQIQADKQSFLDEKAEAIDLPTLIIGAELIKNLTGHFPYEQHPKDMDIWARVGGSQFTKTYEGPSEQKIKEVPGVFFSPNGTLTIKRLLENEQYPDLIQPYQIPIKSQKIA